MQDPGSILDYMMKDISAMSGFYMSKLISLKKSFGRVPCQADNPVEAAPDSQFNSDDSTVWEIVDDICLTFHRARELAEGMPSFELFPDNPFTHVARGKAEDAADLDKEDEKDEAGAGVDKDDDADKDGEDDSFAEVELDAGNSEETSQESSGDSGEISGGKIRKGSNESEDSDGKTDEGMGTEGCTAEQGVDSEVDDPFKLFLNKFEVETGAGYVSEFMKKNGLLVDYLGTAAKEVVDYVFYYSNDKGYILLNPFLSISLFLCFIIS